MLQLILTELHQDEPRQRCQVAPCHEHADVLASAQTDGPFRQARVCTYHIPATMRRLTDVAVAHLECKDIPELVPGGEPMCDSCAYDQPTCPGAAAHCAAGNHCTWTTASCNADRRADDHPAVCCDCGQPLKVRD